MSETNSGLGIEAIGQLNLDDPLAQNEAIPSMFILSPSDGSKN